jgi:hypothetical protein
MAEELIPGLSLSTISGATDGITTAILYIIGLVILGGIVWIIQYWLKFKIKCTIEELVDGSSIVRSDKIRQFNENGVPKFQIWDSLFKFKKDKFAIPKDVFIKTTSKGNKFITLFKTPAGDYLCVRNSKDLMQKISEYDEFTTGQRAMVIQEYREANAYKPTDWSQHIPALAGLTALVIILTVFMLFFNDAVQPMVVIGNQYVAMSEKNAEVQAQQSQTIQILSRVLENIDPSYLQELRIKALQNLSSNNSNYIRPPN